MNRKKDFKPTYTLRSNEYIYSYGPGSILYQKGVSFMPMSQYFWYENDLNLKKDTIKLQAPELKKIIKSREIHQIPGGMGVLPVRQFPEVLVCRDCGKIGKHITFKKLGRSPWKVYCPDCKKRDSSRVQPSNWVLVCDQGHIDDFPFVRFVHGGDVTNCKLRHITMKRIGQTAGGTTYNLNCTNCNTSKSIASLGEVVKNRPEIFTCTGAFPWLGQNYPIEKCVTKNDDETEVETIAKVGKRGESSIYTPAILPSLVLPEKIGESLEYRVLKYRKNAKLSGLYNYIDENINGESNLDEKIRDIEKYFSSYLDEYGFDSKKLVFAAIEVDNDTPTDYIKLLDKEMQVLSSPQDLIEDSPDFNATSFTVCPDLSNLFAKVTRINRLKEIKVLTGFSRLEGTDSRFIDISALTPNELKSPTFPFYPGVENIGEGIYLELNPNRIREVCDQTGFLERISPLMNVDVSYFLKNLDLDTSSPEFVLAHSIAHGLILAISTLTGYPSPSIKERIYVNSTNRNQVGILLYSSSPGSMGGYGGLSRIIDEDQYKLQSIIGYLVNESSWCPSDPICIESLETKFLNQEIKNLGACHSCLLISETSCVIGNAILDRASIIGDIIDNTFEGYFN